MGRKGFVPPNGFKKGKSGNPLGGKLHNPVRRAIKKLTQDQISEIGSFILSNNKEKLNEIVQDKDASILKVWICSIAGNAIKKGDASALNTLLDRIVGKVTDKIEVKVPKPTIIELEGGDKIVLGHTEPQEQEE